MKKIIIAFLILLVLLSFGCTQPDTSITQPENEKDSGLGTTVDEGDTGGLDIMYKTQPSVALVL